MNLATLSRQWSAIFYSGRKIEGEIRSHEEAQKAHKPIFCVFGAFLWRSSSRQIVLHPDEATACERGARIETQLDAGGCW
jgi:hypothetical protein